MKVITAPALEPVTLAEVRANLGFQTADTGQDAIITRRIISAREWVEGVTHRALITQTREIRMDEFGSEIKLPSALTITSVKYIDNDGVLQTVASGDYVLDTYSDMPILRTAYAAEWPSPRNELNAVRVQYTAGFGPAAVDVPSLIREAIMALVGHWMNFQPQTLDGRIVAHIPKPIERMIDPYVITNYR